MSNGARIEALDIDEFTKLLDDNGLPKNTPQRMVVDLIATLEEKNISRDDMDAIEEELQDSALWNWVEGEQVDFVEELPFERFFQRIVLLFGI